MNTEKLESLARQVRKSALDMVYRAKSGHIGGSFSIADVMVAIYFYSWKDGDKFVLSKGHCTPALYSVLALKGFFPRDELMNFRQIGSFLQGHPVLRDVPGVDMSTGSLGQGISAACGMAKAAKLDDSPRMVYAVLGDGELQEGQVWEAAMFASHYKLDNLCAIIDYNGLQSDGKVENVMSVEPLADKWRAFGWRVLEINGHDFGEITKALDDAVASRGKSDKPTAIIARTVKGKGVSFMENNYKWHGVAPQEDEYNLAAKELG